MVKVSSNVTGVGHQTQFDIRALGACRSSLEEAYGHLEGTRGREVQKKIFDLMTEVDELRGSAEEFTESGFLNQGPKK